MGEDARTDNQEQCPQQADFPIFEDLLANEEEDENREGEIGKDHLVAVEKDGLPRAGRGSGIEDHAEKRRVIAGIRLGLAEFIKPGFIAVENEIVGRLAPHKIIRLIPGDAVIFINEVSQKQLCQEKRRHRQERD